jgi:hypothetical protein
MKKFEEYPYIFQSGKYKGRTLEWVFVNDPLHVSRIYRNIFYYRRDPLKKVENKLQLAIENLQRKIRMMEVVKTCPFCKQDKTYFFLLPDRGLIDANLVCCRRESCQQELKLTRPGELYAISDFLIIIAYMDRKEAKSVIKIFKKTHSAFLLADLI